MSEATVGGSMRVVGSFRAGVDKLCLLEKGGEYELEYWVKTKRRKSPFDRYFLGSASDTGVSVRESLLIHPVIKRGADLLMEYEEDVKRLCLIDQVISI